MDFFEGELLGEQDHHYGPHRVGRGEKTGYRTIPAKDTSNKSWKRFALLPNVEGQKYTIGNTFTSREEQGELIFWFDVGDEALRYVHIKPNSLCEISIVKNAYWIRPLMDNTVCVNDVEIKASTLLKFGDHISFGAGRKYWAKVLDKEPSPIRLLFKKREFPPEIMSPLPKSPGRNQWDQDSATSLGQNSLLVSLILSHIPVQNIKQLRLISKVWNDEGVKLVKKKCQVHFNFAEEGWGFDESNKSMKLFQYSVDMKNCLLQNWKITLPSIKLNNNENGIDCSDGKPGAKLLADLEWFLLPQNLGHSVRKLELDGNVASTWDLDVRLEILENLAATLQDLVLSGDWNNCQYTSKEFKFPTLNFKRLERFTPRMVMYRLFEQQSAPLIQFLIKSIQGVRAIQLHSLDDRATDFLQELNSFPNLEEVDLNYATPRGISLLLSLEKPLKKIELNKIHGMEMEDVKKFEALIQFHSNSLESLEFDVPQFYQCNDSVRIALPVMPKLKNLSIGILRSHSCSYGNMVTLNFPDGRLNYTQQFPNLQSLTLRDAVGIGHFRPISEMDKFWEKNEAFYDMFFPQKVPQICRTLRYLDILFEDKDHHVFPRAAQVADMFPNVHNQWINEARKN